MSLVIVTFFAYEGVQTEYALDERPRHLDRSFPDLRFL